MAVNVGTAVAYLDLNMTAFNSGLEQARSALQTLSSDTASVGDKITATGGVITNVGQNLTRNFTVPIVGFGQSAIQASRDFESAFAGVKKTIDETRFNEYAVTWDDLSNAIQEMANETGISAEEIAGVMEYAGQLGVALGDGGKNIIEFTRQMVMLGVATNMTAQDASLELAKFMKVTKLMNGSTEESAANVRGLGSAITALGNNFPTQEADITQMSQRLASAGTTAGLTAQEILALSTAISSAGIKTEAGASSMSTTLTMIEKIVKGVGENSEEKLQKIAEVSGMTAEEFSNTWKTKPIDAIKAFLVGLGQADTETESMILILDELGMTSIRQSNLLRALGLSAENMSYAIDVANQSWQNAYGSIEPAGALVEEFNKRMETLDSRLNMLNERWKDVKREVAEVLLPALENLLDTLNRMIDAWNGLDEAQKKQIVQWAGIVAAIGPFLAIIGTVITSLGKVVGIFEILTSAKTLGGLSNGVSLVQNLNGHLSNVLKNTVKITNNIRNEAPAATAAVEGATAAVQGATSAVKNNAEVVGKTKSVLGATKESITEVSNAINVADGGVLNLDQSLGNANVTMGGLTQTATASQTVINGVGASAESTSGSFGLLGLKMVAIIAVIALVIAAIVDLWRNNEEFRENVIRIWDAIVNFVQTAWAAIKPVFDVLLELIVSIIKAIEPIIATLASVLAPVLETILGVLGSLIEVLAPIVEIVISLVIPVIQSVAKALEILAPVLQFIGDIVGSLIELVGGGLVLAFDGLASILRSMADGIREAWENVFGWIEEMVDKFVDWWNNLGIVKWVKEVADAIGGFFSGGGFKISGSHANGLDYVPYDGYIAELHKGERVLTAKENKEYGNVGGSNNGTTINFYSNEKIDEYTAARELRRTMHDIELGLV